MNKLLSLLNKLNIRYDLKHKNVSTDRCVGICCPFCDDKGFHGGIFLDGLHNFTCWRCKTNVSLFRVVSEITNISYTEFNSIVRKARVEFTKVPAKEVKKVVAIKKIDFPEYYTPIVDDDIPELVKVFLNKRNFTINDCIRYKAGYCQYGEYANRFIIPVFWNNSLVAFQGRDMTGWANFKYKTSQARFNPINLFLYGYEKAKDRIIIVEGVFDKWRIGSDAVCSFGASLTDAQKKLVLDKKANEVIFAWEKNAYIKSKKQAKELKPFLNKVKVLLLPTKSDPDTLGKDFIENLIATTSYI